MLHDLFDPLHDKLTVVEDRTFTALAEPVSPQKATSWPMVDEENRELQRRFHASSTPQDYRAIGGHCVGVLEAPSRTVYDPAKHLYEGETEPAPDKTKQRLGRYIELALPGASNVELRGLVTKAIEFAQRVKHDHTPTRREARDCCGFGNSPHEHLEAAGAGDLTGPPPEVEAGQSQALS